MSRPGSAQTPGGGARASLGSGGSGPAPDRQGPKNRPISQQQQQQAALRNSVPGAGPTSSPGNSHALANNAAPAAPKGGTPTAPHRQSQSKAANGVAAPNLTASLQGLLSKPVVLTLDDDQKKEVGLLWAVDTEMGIVALEIPRPALDSAQQLSSTSHEYPTSAASYPSAMLTTVKVAAQGGDSTGARTNFSVISLRRVQRVEELSKSSDASLAAATQALAAAQPSPVNRDVNVVAAEAREKAAVAEATKRASKIGTGVSKLGQDVFDALNKTLPCRWADQHIIVMDEVVISPDKYDAAVIPGIPSETLSTLAEGGDVSGAAPDARAKATRWQRVAKVLAGERKRILGGSAQ